MPGTQRVLAIEFSSLLKVEVSLVINTSSICDLKNASSVFKIWLIFFKVLLHQLKLPKW